MSDERPTLKVGDKVKVRHGSTLEFQRSDRLSVVGIVVAAEDLPAYGRAVKVRWPDEEVSPAFSSADQYDLVNQR